MKKKSTIKKIGIWFCLVMTITGGTLQLTHKDFIGLPLTILFAIILIFLIISNKNEIGQPKEVRQPKERFVLENELQKNNFVLSKKLRVGFHTFLVDDVNKKFAVNTGKALKFYNFSDLIDFELTEDGDSITKGKGLTTAVGGLTFGVVGAMVGSSGKRKTQSTCTSMTVRIMMNDLNNPQIVINFISFEVKKSSFIYTSNQEAANNLIATLNYIENQNSK